MQCLTPAGIAGVAVYATDTRELLTGNAAFRGRDGRVLDLDALDVPRLAELWIDGRIVDEVLVSKLATRVEMHTHGTIVVDAALRGRFAFDDVARDPAHQLLRSALSVEQFDFAAEQVQFCAAEHRRNLAGLGVEERTAAIACLSERSRVARAHVDARRVVLVGAQNAGKSSLFNRLVMRERSLSGPLAGLTRDPVREVTTLTGYPYEIVDTAGEPIEISGDLDRRAIATGRAMWRGAIVVLVLDGSEAECASHARRFQSVDLVLAAKSDRPSGHWPGWLPADLRVSARNESAETLRSRFGDLLRAFRGLPPAGPVAGPVDLALGGGQGS